MKPIIIAAALLAKPLPDSPVPFSAAEVAWAAMEGENTVTGSALIRTVGGEVRTCAGFEVSLVPVSAYATDRVQRLYGNTQAGFNPSRSFKSAHPDYASTIRKQTCDPQGGFTFRNVPDGSYYLQTLVTWRTYWGEQGGSLMQRVTVEGGEVVDVVLTG